MPALAVGGSGIRMTQRGSETHLWIPGTMDPERSAAFEEAIWDRLHFASHLRTERLGEFTIGTELHRSEPLAVAQLLVLYQLVTARAAVALGARGARADQDGAGARQSSAAALGAS
jgi:phosphoribulokinase